MHRQSVNSNSSHAQDAPMRKTTRFTSLKSACITLMIMLCATATFAIHPGNWTHTTEADFEKGEIDGVVVTNLGDIKLATATESQGDLPEGVNVIYDMCETADGTLYLAAGPGGRLLKKKGDKIEQILELENEHIFALDLNADGSLLLGISGEKSRLAFLDGDKLKTLVTLESARYIWDTAVDGNDVFLATGPEGMLLHVNLAEVFANKAKEKDPPAKDGANNDANKDAPKPAPAKDAADAAPDTRTPGGAPKKPDKKAELPAGVKVVMDAAQANLICLERDAQGRLFVGTDTDGLVYRVTMQPGQPVDSFVVYDAEEPEIGALLILPDGTLYAGTADAGQARPGRLQAAKTAESGRPAPGGTPDKVKVPTPPKPDPKNGGNTGAKTGAKTDGKTDGKGTDTKTANGPAINAKDDDGPLANKVEPDNGQAKTDQPLANANVAAPTAEQYDQLREEIRSRLMTARKTGELQVSSGSSSSTPSRSTRPSLSRPTTTTKRASKAGNAVYRIDASGFVTEVFRETVMILRLIVDGESLLVATGNEGQIFRVNPNTEETIIVADLDLAQIPAMLKTKDGSVLIGTESPASLVKLNGAFAEQGVYVSDVLDASQISLWGKFNITGAIPQGTTVSVESRSGNVSDPDRAAWSKWSVPTVLAHDAKVTPLTPRELSIASPPARFFQYRLRMTGNGKTSSVVDRVSMAYVVPNIKPAIASIRADYVKPKSTDASQAKTKMNVTWKATDANKDALRYRLDYRLAGTSNWLEMAKDLDRASHEWQTLRVPDGRYLIRVTATDELDNPTDMAKVTRRQSDPILIDNTPPTIGERQTRIENGVTTIKTTVSDALSGVARVQYAVDSTEDWQALLPDDLIYDSTKENMTVKILGLSVGSHVVTLRATDKLGNTQYTAEVIEIK